MAGEVEGMTSNVYTALREAQENMGPLVKGSVNPHFRSKYADLADLVDVVRPALNSAGLTFFHSMNVESDSFYQMGTILVHGESGTRIECWVPLIVAKNDMQGMKSATTYAKRIGLESVTGIAPEDDDGNAAAKAAPNKASPRDGLGKPDPAEVAEYVAKVRDILDSDADEYEHAAKLRGVHEQLRGRTELYVALSDELGKQKICSKAEWRNFMKLERPSE